MNFYSWGRRTRSTDSWLDWHHPNVAVVFTSLLFVVYGGLTRLEWFSYIGSDIWNPHLRGWNADSGQLPWLAACAALLSISRLWISGPKTRSGVALLVLVLGCLLVVPTLLIGRAEAGSYGRYERMLAGAWLALLVASTAVVTTLTAIWRHWKAKTQRSRSRPCKHAPRARCASIHLNERGR